MRARSLHRALAILGVAVAALSASASTSAAPQVAHAAAPAPPRGRPKVVLDRLEFPDDVSGARSLKKFLVRQLAHEARRALWGAGRGSTISYRFEVTELSISVDGEVLRVSCTAVGRLPGGRSARSNLSFGGDPRKRSEIMMRVLGIVARGVITRLAEIERERRGETRVRVRAPVVVEPG